MAFRTWSISLWIERFDAFAVSIQHLDMLELSHLQVNIRHAASKSRPAGLLVAH